MVLELYVGFFNNLLMWQYVFSKQEGIFSGCSNCSSFTLSFFILTLYVFYFVLEADSMSAAILHFVKTSQEGIRHTLTFVCIFTRRHTRCDDHKRVRPRVSNMSVHVFLKTGTLRTLTNIRIRVVYFLRQLTIIGRTKVNV